MLMGRMHYSYLFSVEGILVDAGADVNCVTIKGETAISLLFARKISILTSMSEDVTQFLVNSFKTTSSVKKM